MHFTTFFVALAALASATPLLDTVSGNADVAVNFDDLIPVTSLASETVDIEARGSTPWHNCKCFDGYITDEKYSGVYEKTVAFGENFSRGISFPQNTKSIWLGPSKYFLITEVIGKNTQQFTKSRIANIIHQLKVARGDKSCGTKPVVCWTQGDNEIKAYVKQYF